MMTRVVGLRPCLEATPYYAFRPQALYLRYLFGELVFGALEARCFVGVLSKRKRHDSRAGLHPDSTHKITESHSSSASLSLCLEFKIYLELLELLELETLVLSHALYHSLSPLFCWNYLKSR